MESKQILAFICRFQQIPEKLFQEDKANQEAILKATIEFATEGGYTELLEKALTYLGWRDELVLPIIERLLLVQPVSVPTIVASFVRSGLADRQLGEACEKLVAEHCAGEWKHSTTPLRAAVKCVMLMSVGFTSRLEFACLVKRETSLVEGLELHLPKSW